MIATSPRSGIRFLGSHRPCYQLGEVFSSNISNQLSPAQIGFWLFSLALWVWAIVELGFLRGTKGPNRYGPDPLG